MDERLVALAGHAPLAVLLAADLALRNGATLESAYLGQITKWTIVLTYLRDDSLRTLRNAGFVIDTADSYHVPRGSRRDAVWQDLPLAGMHGAYAGLMR